MALDPNIALGYKGVQIESPLAQYAQVAQLQNAQNQNALAQTQIRAAQRSEQDTEALRNALAGTKYGTPEYEQALTGTFLKTGNVKGLQEYQKGQRETEKSAAELAVKQQELKRSIFGNLAMNPSDENVKAHLQDLVIQKQMTPQEAESWLAKTTPLNPAQRVKMFNELGQTADQRVGHEISRGQLGVAQSQLKVSQAREARLAAGGELKPVPIHAQKAMTGAASTLGQIDAAIAALKANPSSVGLIGLTPDIALNRMDPEGTAARAALADIGSLKLHERSGAAVTASETPRLKPFIPAITDDYETALKKLERMRDIQAAEEEVLTGTYNPTQGFKDFRAATPSGAAKPAAPAAPMAPKAGIVQDGYRFKGGDPADPKNWEKM